MRQMVSKRLTKNDLGMTGGHQGGICVPFKIAKLGFFPTLDSFNEYNPRAEIEMEYDGKVLKFTYIHYNSRLHKAGTRNEYRLSGMTKFFKENNCIEGDLLEFSLNDGRYSIDIKHRNIDDEKGVFDLDKPLFIRSDWAYKRGRCYEY